MKRLRRLLIGLLALALLPGIVLVVVRLGRPAPTDHQAELFPGILYTRQARATPRPLLVHIVEIDLTRPGIGLFVTPGEEENPRDLPARTTATFLREFELQLAINGSFFEPFRAGTPWDYAPKQGDPVNIKGLAISNGVTYSNDYPNLPALCVWVGQAQIRDDGCPGGTDQALAGNWILVQQGQSNAKGRSPELHPRTAVAVDAAGTTLWLIVVDGRQRGYSEGVSLEELAEIVLELGAETALNLDGGGSSTLVAAGPWGPRTLNAPIHTRIPMRQRPVGNHLGVYAQPGD